MAYKINDYGQTLPKLAASAVGANLAVSHSASAKDQVVLIATSGAGAHPLGITVATAASPGDPVAVQTQGVVKAIAAASVGAGAAVGVASEGRLGPVTAGGASAIQQVGISQEAAAAGVTFSVLLRPFGGA